MKIKLQHKAGFLFNNQDVVKCHVAFEQHAIRPVLPKGCVVSNDS